MNQQICRYNKYGFCKYGDKSHFRHGNVMCVNKTCTVFQCELRHPVVCNYFRNFKRCKFSNCAYKHENVNDVKGTNEKIETIQTKLNEIEKKAINEIGKEIKMFDLAKQVDKKIENFENQLNHFKKAIEEKDVDIINLKKKVEQLEKKSKE